MIRPLVSLSPTSCGLLAMCATAPPSRPGSPALAWVALLALVGLARSRRS